MRSRIFIRGCVRPSVHQSVGPSVRRLVTHQLKPRKSAIFVRIYYQYERERIFWPCIRPCFFLHSWFFVNHYLSANCFFEVFYSKSIFFSWFFVSPFFSRVDFFIDVDISLPKSRHSRHFSSFTWFQECREKHSWFVNHVTRVIHATRRSLLDFKGAEKKSWFVIPVARVIHATRHLSLNSKGLGKVNHDLSLMSLASFTPLVICHWISRVRDNKIMVCHSRRSCHSHHSSFVTQFKGCSKSKSWFVNHVTRVIHATRRSLLDFKGAEKKSWFVIPVARVIHATRHLSLNSKGVGKVNHDLSLMSLASFTPLVVRHSISRVRENKITICH